MSPVVFQLDFTGGPQDGLRAYSLMIPDTRLLFPLSREANGSTVIAYCRIDDGTAAMYQFDHTCLRGRRSHCLPVMHYRFSGFRPTVRRKHFLLRAMRWNSTSRRLVVIFERAWRRLRDWMLEPIAYPLQLRYPNENRETTTS